MSVGKDSLPHSSFHPKRVKVRIAVEELEQMTKELSMAICSVVNMLQDDALSCNDKVEIAQETLGQVLDKHRG